MIAGLVFSKDRACQLHLFLESVERNTDNLFNLKVLYHATTEEYSKAYKKLIERFPSVVFIKQGNFKQDTLEVCKSFSEPTIAFFVDDDIIYRKLELQEDFLDIFKHGVCSLSLRLGSNTVIQDTHTGSRAIMPQIDGVINDKFYCWSWKNISQYHTNFGYPFSVDGNIYPREEIISLFDRYDFDTPNSLEGAFNKEWLSYRPNMACMELSCLINTPLNLVGSSQNMAGKFFGISLEKLNEKYLKDCYIDYDKIDFSNIMGCHQELKMEFTCNLHLG